MNRIDHNDWQILGYFHYHDRVVALKASPEEDNFVLLRMTREEQREPVYFADLHLARDAFTKEVHDILFYTSYTDVSLYMQQRAGTESPKF